MKRIAMVLAGPFPAPRGSQVLVQQLLVGLRERGYAVSVWSHPAAAPSRPSVGPRRLVADLRLFLRLWRAAASDRMDLLHAHNYEAALLALAVRALTGVPVVFHGHAAFADELPTYVSSSLLRAAAVRFGRWLDAWVPQRASHNVAVSEALAARWRSHGVAADAIDCVEPSLAAHEVPPCSAPPTALRLGYAGNRDGYQNLDLLRRVIRAIRTHEPSAVLDLILHEPWPANVADEAGIELIRVDTPVAMQSALAACAVTVLPRTEGTGFPMKLLNYRAAARPTVAFASAAKGLHDGVDGLVVADGDEAAFVGACLRLLRDPALCTALGRAARQRVEDRTAWTLGLDRIEAGYRRVRALGAPAFLPLSQTE